MTKREKPILCLAASGGGHVRQLLDLKPLWQDYPHFFVTEDTALGRSIARDEDTEFVPHFAWGQARLGRPVHMFMAAWRSIWQSARIILRRRPDAVITTGAGSQLFIVLWARMLGAKIILVDSFARFGFPSKFARVAGPLAHLRIVQSAESGKHWPGSLVFDPLKFMQGERPPKEPLLFATVGAILPFPRLTAIVADAKRKGLIPERIISQVGCGGDPVEPCDGMEMVEELRFDEIGDILSAADIVVCHGGTGSLLTALTNHCRVIAIPRRLELGESYDNHQFEITENFVQRGLIEFAEDEDSFIRALAKIRLRDPVPVKSDPTELIAFLQADLDKLYR